MRYRRVAGALIVAAIIYALAGFAFVPWLADRIATEKVREILGAELRIGDIRFNPFTFAVAVEDIEFDHPSGDRFAVVGAIEVNFEPTAMLGGTLLFSEARVVRPEVFLVRDAQGVLNAATIQPLGPPAGSPDASDPWPLVITSLQVEAMSVRLTDNTVAPAAQVGIDDLSLEARQFSTAPNSLFPVEVSMRLTTGGTISAQGEMGLLPEPVVGMKITLDVLSPAIVHSHLQSLADITVDSGSLHFTGDFRIDPEEQFALQGDARIDDLLLTETEGGARLGSWDRLAVNGVALSLARQSLRVSEVVLDRPYADILIAENGSINLRRAGKGAEALEGSQDEAGGADDQPGPARTEPEVPAEQPGPAFDVTVGRVVVNNASASFEDRALPLPFTAKIDELNGRLSTIATSSDVPSEIALEGRVDEFGQVLVSGQVTPLAPQKDTNINVDFVNVGMPKFSAYTIRFAGHEIASGKLDLKLGYEIRDSKLVGENSIVLSEFELGEKVAHPDAINLPLGLAVALLKDSSGRINVDLPISGDVDNPEFSIAGVVGDALGNLVTGIATAPFKFLGNLLGIEASELEALHFPPGRADLSPPQQQVAASLGEALAMRPELVLELAGVYHEAADGHALREAAVDERIEAEIGDAESYAERRIAVIETLFREATGETLPPEEADPVARAARLRERLIESEPLADDALAMLAAARADNTRDYILASAPTLSDRVSVDSVEVARNLDDGKVRMELSLAPGGE